MKIVVLAASLILSSFFWSITAQNQVIKDSLSISKQLHLNETVSFMDYEVKFKKVIRDSRCPKNVMCVRAGEADVLVSIYKCGNFVEDKKIKIDASGYVMEANSLAFDTSDIKIYGFSLMPYPDSVGHVEEKEYQLEIVFQPKGLN